MLGRRVDDRAAVLAVVGLGYVGLPAASLFAAAGFEVIGVERNDGRRRTIAQGDVPLEGDEPGLPELLKRVVAAGKLRVTGDAAALSSADIVLVCVETPVAEDHLPRYEALRAACRDIGTFMRPGTVVIVESTIAPGTMDRVVRPALEDVSRKVSGRDFHIGHCPERVMPGKLVKNMRTMSRVCGGDDAATAELIKRLYSAVVEASLDTSDMVTAEVVKTAENAYRDVNIAFANEVALICEAVGADAGRVRELVNKSPGRHMLVPGAGVGGHCIPKDPWLLVASVDGKEEIRLIPAARAVNDSMPRHVADLVADGLAAYGRSTNGATVAVLGYSYLENTGDVRNSPSVTLVEELKRRGAEVRVHDPFVPGLGGDYRAAVRSADAIALVVAHDEYRVLPLAELREIMRTPVLVDGRGVVAARSARDVGFTYFAVGLPRFDGHSR